MSKERNETLREYLDRIHIESGDDSGFAVQELGKATEMQVSRRYLECETWNYILDCEIVDFIYPFVNIYGQRTIKFIVQKIE